MTVNNIRPHASHDTGKMCKTNRRPFYHVYKTSSREFKRNSQSILPIEKMVGCVNHHKKKYKCQNIM